MDGRKGDGEDNADCWTVKPKSFRGDYMRPFITENRMDNKIHIVYGTDDNYIFPTMVSAASALYYAKDKSRIVIHLFDAGVSDAHYDDYCHVLSGVGADVELVRHKLSPSMFAGYGAWKGSVVTYSRMFMCELLPDIDWAIYVDGDTLWLGDPAELWTFREESKLVLASIDPPPAPGFESAERDWYEENGLKMNSGQYLCMGLMLANLRKMREYGLAQRCREFMTRYSRPRVVDQTVLNYICQGQSAALPRNWGVFSVWHKGVDLSRPSLVHYCSDVPWERRKVNRLFSDVVLLWFEFCRQVLGMDELSRFSTWDRIWRRTAFNLLRRAQWLVKCNRFVLSRFRNTHGISRKEFKAILAGMQMARLQKRNQA